MLDDDDPSRGLSDDEAAARLARDGPNRIQSGNGRGLARIAWGVVTQPMVLLLLATAVVYAVVGSAGDALVLLVSVVGVALISVVQETRTERVLESLKELSSPRSRVVRSGRVLHVGSQELVQGDRLLIAAGDRLACDADVAQANGLLVDESTLTGESAPVPKFARQRVHAGSLVVQGDAVCTVCATGERTALGKIGGALAQIEPRPSRAQAELKRIVARVAVFAALSCIVAAALYALRSGSWVEGVLAGLTLAMAIIPEEFAVVWGVMLALGAWRLAQHGVLTRQGQAIEALGTTTALCVDKTGTLTNNRMELVALAAPFEPAVWVAGGRVDASLASLLHAAALASVDDGLEPMDNALLRVRERSFGATPLAGVLLRREGIGIGRMIFSQWWRTIDGPATVLAVKGAPEAVLARCSVDSERAAGIMREVGTLAGQGLRVLGVAMGTCADACDGVEESGGSASPRDPTALVWCGLLGFLDPVRSDVPAAIATCREAGMRVVMITGDAPATAGAIARAAGLDAHDARTLSGAQLTAMTDADLDRAVETTSVFARVSPDHKLRIVRALQRRGEVVAMTGDGVNDAAALRAADIGIAMGRRGTDVAREAATLVLLDDSFSALVSAVRMGRRIFGNLRNAVGYLLAVHVPIVGVSLMPVIAGGPVLLLPLHVVLLELLIDPACSLVFEAEPEPADCMTRPPRPAHDGLVSLPTVLRSLGIGLIAFLALVLVVGLARRADLDASWLRLITLGALIVGNLLMLQRFRHMAGIRDRQRSNRAFGWLLAGAAVACAGILLAAPLLPQLGLPSHDGLRVLAVLFAGLSVLLGLRLRRNGVRRTSLTAVVDTSRRAPG